MDVELALKINKLIHDECSLVSHDIGLRISELIEKHQADRSAATATEQAAECSPAVCYAMSSRELREAIALMRNIMVQEVEGEVRRKLEVHLLRLLEMQGAF